MSVDNPAQLCNEGLRCPHSVNRRHRPRPEAPVKPHRTVGQGDLFSSTPAALRAQDRSLGDVEATGPVPAGTLSASAAGIEPRRETRCQEKTDFESKETDRVSPLRV